jgi:hypothetical protein
MEIQHETLYAAFLSVLLVSGATALAQSGPAAGSAGAMSDTQIKQQLESQGYTNVKVTEHDKDHVDVTATKNGQSQNSR